MGCESTHRAGNGRWLSLARRRRASGRAGAARARRNRRGRRRRRPRPRHAPRPVVTGSRCTSGHRTRPRASGDRLVARDHEPAALAGACRTRGKRWASWRLRSIQRPARERFGRPASSLSIAGLGGRRRRRSGLVGSRRVGRHDRRRLGPLGRGLLGCIGRISHRRRLQPGAGRRSLLLGCRRRTARRGSRDLRADSHFDG